MDPSNMEAFDNCQTSGCHVPIDIIPASRQHWQDETAALSAEKDCFFLNISNEYMKADFTGGLAECVSVYIFLKWFLMCLPDSSNYLPYRIEHL